MSNEVTNQNVEELAAIVTKVKELVDEATGYSVPYRRSRFMPIDSVFTNALNAALRGEDV